MSSFVSTVPARQVILWLRDQVRDYRVVPGQAFLGPVYMEGECPG